MILLGMFNSHIRGWINYYGRYYKSALYPTLLHIDKRSGTMGPSEVQVPETPQATDTSLVRPMLFGASLICSYIGDFSMDAAEQWEPDEARASRPVPASARR